MINPLNYLNNSYYRISKLLLVLTQKKKPKKLKAIVYNITHIYLHFFFKILVNIINVFSDFERMCLLDYADQDSSKLIFYNSDNEALKNNMNSSVINYS